MRIIEEGLTFGDFDEANCFHIEKTDIYTQLSGKGIKSVEFVLYKPEDRKLLFIEGKKTLPAKNNKISFDEEISEISYKFMDSLQLACGIWFGGHNSKVEIPKNGTSFFGYGVQIVFILVVKNRTGDLLHIADRIKKQLPKEHRLWKFEVLVLNESKASEERLIVLE
jgi:hypothetical protein